MMNSPLAARLICWLFTRLWAHRLIDDFTGKPCVVLCVKDWRTALVRTPTGQRMTTTFL